jgi:hypothetical protein
MGGKRKTTVGFDLPVEVLEAAAERANAENRSLTEVTVTLLRDYAAGTSWLNLPRGDDGIRKSGDG